MHEIKLVIAEKPSVAQSLAKVIGEDKRQDGYLEGGGYLVSWCVGHLVELSAPERYDERYAKWRLEDLPILPERFPERDPQRAALRFIRLSSLPDGYKEDDIMAVLSGKVKLQSRTAARTEKQYRSRDYLKIILM